MLADSGFSSHRDGPAPTLGYAVLLDELGKGISFLPPPPPLTQACGLTDLSPSWLAGCPWAVHICTIICSASEGS